MSMKAVIVTLLGIFWIPFSFFIGFFLISIVERKTGIKSRIFQTSVLKRELTALLMSIVVLMLIVVIVFSAVYSIQLFTQLSI